MGREGVSIQGGLGSRGEGEERAVLPGGGWEGNVLMTGADTVQSEKNGLDRRTGSKESHYPDV